MNWSFSLKLMPGEEVVDQQEETRSFGLKTVHTPILTNRRALFRFNSLSSGLIQSFTYDEISDVRPANRLMIKYLRLTSGNREYYLNVDVPEEWALKILGFKEQFGTGQGEPAAASPEAPAGPATEEESAETGSGRSPADLILMLKALRDEGILTDAEFTEKLQRVKG